DGILTDSMGRHVNFRNAIIVMTSNLGSGSRAMEQVGFLANGEAAGAQKALKEFFSPENSSMSQVPAEVTISPGHSPQVCARALPHLKFSEPVNTSLLPQILFRKLLQNEF
ncbi:MAG: AAA family ATPase, partial [Lentisphaeria bacterium]|nr:AAA family ATPase [Lentisphaeria bacterium]